MIQGAAGLFGNQRPRSAIRRVLVNESVGGGRAETDNYQRPDELNCSVEPGTAGCRLFHGRRAIHQPVPFAVRRPGT